MNLLRVKANANQCTALPPSHCLSNTRWQMQIWNLQMSLYRSDRNRASMARAVLGDGCTLTLEILIGIRLLLRSKAFADPRANT